MIKFVDLFAGIGGIRLGVEKALSSEGIESVCVLSSEIDPKAIETYIRNFNETPQGDIRKVEDIEPFDFLLAGFPCQPFSYAGKHQGFGDTRGTLFFEIERILEKYKPKAFLLENVRGLTSHQNGKTFATIQKHLEDLDYKIKPLLLNTSNFGIPQNRVRLYIVGIYQHEPIMSIQSNVGAADSHVFKKKQEVLFTDPNIKTVKDILETDPDKKYLCSNEFTEKLAKVTNNNFEKLHGIRLIDYRGGNSLHSWDIGLKGECSDREKEFMNLLISNRRKKTFGDHQDGKMLSRKQIGEFYTHSDLDEIISSLIKKGYLKNEDGRYNPVCGNMSFEIFKFLDPDSISITITATDSHRLGIVTNGRPRHLTPRECARLQGFPDDFILHDCDTYAYKQIGNSVTVPVIKKIVSDLIKNNNDYLRWK